MDNSQSSPGPLHLLSFDGGGIRGISSLYLLKSIMQNLEAEKGLPADEHLLPCEIFDMIAGTSTGGLIAIMLGILRMDVQTCIDEYINLAPKIFPLEGFMSRLSVVKASKLILGRYRFDARPLEQEIKRLVNAGFKGVKERRGVRMKSELAPDRCKVFVCSNTEKHVKLTLFRNYSAPWDDSENCEIWEACRATSAAPTFFPPILIGNPPVSYVDGALGHNNPIRSVLSEAKQLWPSRNIACMVSIGTGIPSSVDSGPKLKPLVETLKAISTDAERTARQVLQEMESNYGRDQNTYFRFNVQRGLEGVRLDEWKKLESVIVATREYLDSEQRNIQRCVSQINNPTSLLPEKYPQFRIPFTLKGTPIIGHFVPRPAELKDIERCLLETAVPNRRKVFVLHGLGGIGKTQLALEFARTHKKDFTATFWLHGATLDSLKLSLAEAASLVRKGSEGNERVISDDGGDRVDVLSQEALDWLSQEDNHRWLLIYDNCDTLSGEENGYDLLSMFPTADHGSIIITTRRNQLSSLGDSQKMLQGLDETQSIDLLENNIGQKFTADDSSSWDRKWGLSLSNTLDGLPLALVQAARYIQMTGLDIPGYIDLYEKSWADLVQQMPDVQGYEAGSIQRTWAISFARIKRQNPLASNLLQLIARFDCHDIWVDLIMNGNQGTETPEWFRDITKSKVSFLAALGLLFDFSLLRRANAMDSFSMHPVVHQWVAMSVKENLGDFIRIAVVAIAFTSPGDGDPESWILQKRLRPHADRIYGYVCGPSQIAIDWGSWETQDVPKLSEGAEVVEQSWTDAQMEHPLRRLGWLYGEGMQEFEKAKSIFQLGMDTVQEIHGNKHPLVFRFANCLALVCRDLGEWEDAEILANSALQGFLAWFGKENKWTINSLACFPLICYARGEYAKAVELGEELLSILRSNPDAWPDALSYTLNNLSVFYGANDQPDKAIEMIEESLLLKFKRLDPDHPLIMTGLENLAGRYMDAGSYMESERVLKQCIEGYEKSYGLKSRETIAANDYLAHLYHKMGRLVEAEEIYRTAVRDYEELLGLNHPDTVRCASNLCIMIFQQWNEACPFVVDGSGAEQAQAPSPFPRQQLLELCRVMLKYPGQIDYFGYVAKVLFRYGKSDQSRLVLQGQATREYGCWSYTSRSCDAIDSEHFIGSERFACMVCEDLDLCRDCMATYNGQKINGGGCIGHPFLDVSIPSRMLSVNLLDQAKSTLRAIIEEYSATDTTALHVVMSTSEASQKRDATSPKKIPVIREQTFGTKLQAISWLKPNRKGK